MPKRAAVYVRISQDTDGEGLGVARQTADCRALIERHGWTLAAVHTDNDVSAYNGRPRPGYRALLDQVTAHQVDVVVAWHPDRLHRSPRELEDFIDLLERTGCQVTTCTAGDVDLSTPEGRLTARIVGSVARKESEDKSRRLRRKHLELAEAGRPVGPRAFGYQRGLVDVDEAEAELVREAARRIVAGESLWVIVRDWTDRGVPTVRGGAWSTTALRGIVTSPRVAGLRAHHGQVVAEGVWPAILDRETWEQTRAVLAGRTRRREWPARNYLLSGGVAVCGTCEASAALVAAPRPYGRAYACLSSHGGCNGCSVIADPLEQLVANRLAAAVAGGLLDRVRRARPVDDRDVPGLIVLEERRLVQYAAMLDAGEISRPEWQAMREGAQSRLDGLRREMEQRAAPAVLAGAEASTWAGLWDGWGFEQRRAAVRALVDRVEVVSARRRPAPRNTFDPDRATVTWTA